MTLHRVWLSNFSKRGCRFLQWTLRGFDWYCRAADS
ncbi:hypothetical protein [Coxiella-like endosymbiont]